MRLNLICALAASLLGCASSQQVTEDAMRHEQRARLEASRGNYAAAERQQRAAEKERLKAMKRAYEE